MFCEHLFLILIFLYMTSTFIFLDWKEREAQISAFQLMIPTLKFVGFLIFKTYNIMIFFATNVLVPCYKFHFSVNSIITNLHFPHLILILLYYFPISSYLYYLFNLDSCYITLLFKKLTK
jgi:hypothetical protein